MSTASSARHPALVPGHVAVVTGGASGIGLAAARRFAGLGLKVVIADVPGDGLVAAVAEIAGVSPGGAGDVLGVPTDVSIPGELRALEARARAAFGRVDVLMNNAGIQPGSDVFDEKGTWRRIIEVNLWGVVQGAQVFGPGMIAQQTPGLIINTGSKQGITTPPGDPAYNVAKAGVKAFSEALQHQLRTTPGCRVSAYLLIPGFVHTPLTARGRVGKPAGAWTAEETVDFMLERIAVGDFYILCPDNEVTRTMDERRILWAAGDVVENRPPLSRWHPAYGEAFAAFLNTSGKD